MQLQQLLAVVAVSLAVCDAQMQPRFNFTPRDGIMCYDRKWQVGETNCLSFASSNSLRFEAEVRLEGGSCTKSSCTEVLMYKCPKGGFSSLSLTGLSISTGTTVCDTDALGNMPVTFKRLAAEGTFEFLFSGEEDGRSGRNWRKAFDDKIELKMQVQCPSVTLTSNSLFVSDFRALLSANTEEISDRYSLQLFQRRILTEKGVEFMANANTGSDEFGSVDFIDPEIIDSLNSAPEVIRSKIGFKVILTADGHGCSSTILNKYAAVTTDPHGLGHQQSNDFGTMFLNVNDGKLHYSTYGMSKVFHDLMRDREAFEICAFVTAPGESIAFNLKLPVTPQRQAIQTSSQFQQRGSPNTNCKVISEASKSISLFSGADITRVTCPIVCSDSGQEFYFKKNGVIMRPAGYLEWREFPYGSIHRTGKTLQFPSTLSADHDGEYSCHAGDKASFTFTVSVVSLPRFEATLPDKVFALEGESINYACTAAFSNTRVTVSAEFITNQQDIVNPEWLSMNKDDFNQLVQPGDEESVNVTTASNTGRESLTVTATVPEELKPVRKNFTHRFVCKASVDAEDAKKLGMDSYSVQTSSSVFFVRRPTMSDFIPNSFDCSEPQRCRTESGEEFAVSLRPELSQYLRGIGVEVRAYFRVGLQTLEEFLGINGNLINGNRVEFDSVADTLRFSLRPISDKELLRNLSNVVVTPVFSFHYPKDVELRSLQYSPGANAVSDAPSKQCTVEERCLYSTEADIDGELSSLAFRVDFGFRVEEMEKKLQGEAGDGVTRVEA